MAYHRINEPERLHALIDAIFLIEADASLSTLLSRIVEAAANLVGARYGALGVLASNGETLSRFITFGIDDHQRALIGESPRGSGLLGETIRVAQPLRVDELSAHPSSAGFPAHHPPMHRSSGCRSRPATGTSSATSTSPTRPTVAPSRSPTRTWSRRSGVRRGS